MGRGSRRERTLRPSTMTADQLTGRCRVGEGSASAGCAVRDDRRIRRQRTAIDAGHDVVPPYAVPATEHCTVARGRGPAEMLEAATHRMRASGGSADEAPVAAVE